ncbi:hypothetical protein Tco_0052429 [Tanacetum coccineum]
MIKFLTSQGVVTMETSREALRECKPLERVQGSWKEVQWRQHEEQMSRIREQMANISEDIQCVGSDARPPMLDRTDFASWQQRIRLYCRGKENGVNILKSIDEEPFQMGTIKDTLAEGTEDKDMYNADIRATNILLQGLPKDIYTLINHYTEAKYIWDNVKMLLEGSELTKEDRESQLFVTPVKLNRGLRDSNYDQLYAYLKQHEQYYLQSSTTLPSTQVQPHFADNTQLDSGLSPTDNLIDNLTNKLALLTQSYKTYLPQTNNQLKTSSNTRNQATVQDGKIVVQNVQGHQNRGHGNNERGTCATGYEGAQNRVGNTNPGQARQIKCYYCNGIGRIARNCTQPKRPQNSKYFKYKMLLMQPQENGVALDEAQLLFIASGQDNVVDEDVDEQPVQDLALNMDNTFQANDCNTYDSDVDEAPTAQTMFMASLSSAYPVYDETSPLYDSDILSEVPDHDNYQDAVCEHHQVHEMYDDVQLNYVVDSHTDYASDSNMIPYDQYVKDNAVSVVQSNVSSVPNDASMMILNYMHEMSTQCGSGITQNNVVDKSLTAELATYKEQVKLYEDGPKNLRKELHSVKLQLTSTINHHKSMVEEVTSLKKDFKQKENKYLEEFLDMKALKEKVEDKVYKQDYSLQTVHMLCKPKPYYDEKKKVAIGYKNPLCLTRVKQVQSALYNGHEIIKTNHVSAIVHNSKDTLEIAEITNNYLATFTPHKQLTPEQIFWSKDLIKMKAEALKEQTTASRPIKALMVYPLNTPTTLALTKEIKERKDIFEELEAEVDQNVVNRKHDEIERKNLLIANDNLIADCLSKEVFYIAMNSELTISRFTEMHDAHTIVQAHCLELELKYKNLKESFGNNISPPARDAPDLTQSLVENAKIKQHYKELYDSIKITHAKHIEQTTALLTENENLKAQIHENIKCITMDSVKPRVLAPSRYAIDVAQIPPHIRNNREVHLDYLKHLKESVETLHEIVEEAKELLEYVIGTCPKYFNKQDKKHASTPLTRKKQVTFDEQCEASNNNAHKHVEKLNIQKTDVPVIPSTGVNSGTDASGSQPRSHTKKNRILPAKSVNKKKVEEHPRTNKSSLKTTNRVDSSISSKRTAVLVSSPTSPENQEIIASMQSASHTVLWYLDSSCSKHMTGDRSRLRNFVKKFIGIVRFENDHFGAIMGYEDYVIGDSVISLVYYVEGLGYNLFSVGQFYDSNLEVAFKKHSCYVLDTDGVELIKGSHGSNLYTISIEDMMKSSLICLLSKASKNKSWL